MTLKQWHDNSWLRPHQAQQREIADLLQIVDRDLKDVQELTISNDWRFGIAYNAALKLCTILLNAEGYRPERTLQHYRTIQALPLILGPEWNDDARYLDTCRAKRNIVEYDQIGAATSNDADELISFVRDFRQIVYCFRWSWGETTWQLGSLTPHSLVTPHSLADQMMLAGECP